MLKVSIRDKRLVTFLIICLTVISSLLCFVTYGALGNSITTIDNIGHTLNISVEPSQSSFKLIVNETKTFAAIVKNGTGPFTYEWKLCPSANYTMLVNGNAQNLSTTNSLEVGGSTLTLAFPLASEEFVSVDLAVKDSLNSSGNLVRPVVILESDNTSSPNFNETTATASYIIQTDGKGYQAINCSTGSVIYSSIDANFVCAQVLAASDCHTIYFADGIFCTSLIINKPIKIMGTGSNTTILKATGNNPVITISGTQDCIIDSLGINGLKNIYPSSSGILLGNTIRCIIQNCFITNCGGDGVDMTWSSGSAYENKLINSWIGGDSTYGAANYPYGNNGYGVVLGADDSIDNCVLMQNGLSGIKMASTTKVVGSTIWGNRQNGVLAEATSDYEISNNIITDNRMNGILIDGSFRGSIHDNQIRDNSNALNSGVYDGIRIQETNHSYYTQNNLIYNNKIFDSQTCRSQNYAINLLGGTYNYVHDNYVLGNLKTINVATSEYFVYNNEGYSDHSSGTVTMVAGQTTVTISHGLVGTPRYVNVTPSGSASLGVLSVQSIGNSTFKIVSNSIPTSNVTIYWEAKWAPYGYP